MIRPFRVLDILALKRLDPYTLRLCTSSSSHGPLGNVLIGTWLAQFPLLDERIHTYVQDMDGQVVAFAQAVGRPGRLEWDIAAIGFCPDATSVRSGISLVAELLEYLSIDAGMRGTDRVFARLDSSIKEVDTFLQARFVPYCYEDRLARSAPWSWADLEPLPERLQVRPRRSADAWSILQLYGAQAPRGVILAESRTCKDWAGHSSGRVLLGHFNRRSYVLMEDDELLGELTLHRRKDNVDVDLLVRPSAYQYAVSFIGAALAYTSWRPVRTVSCQVREYDAPLADELADAGFQVTQRDVLLVRPTTGKVKTMSRFLGPIFEGSLHVPRSTPTLSAREGGATVISYRRTKTGQGAQIR